MARTAAPYLVHVDQENGRTVEWTYDTKRAALAFFRACKTTKSAADSGSPAKHGACWDATGMCLGEWWAA